MWAVKNLDGTIDQHYVGATQREVWFNHAWYVMRDKYGQKWEQRFWKKERASIRDFKKKGYDFIKVEVVRKK